MNENTASAAAIKSSSESDDKAATSTSESASTEASTCRLYIQAFTAGSIASSCCLIQLGINLLSYWNIVHIGCAGFNKTLGPLRPYTRTMTIAWLLWSWMSMSGPLCFKLKMKRMSMPTLISLKNPNDECCSRNNRQHPRRLFRSTLLCLSLMFMPEYLELAGDIITNRKLQQLASLSSPSSSDMNRPFIKMEYVVDNMGCEACVSAVEGILSRHEKVAMAKLTSFEFGTLDLYLYANENENADIDVASSSEGGGRGRNQEQFEREVEDLLQQDGYELHEKGWITKKMKMKIAEAKVKNSHATFMN